MRYCLPALLLFAVLPLLNVRAAPVPAPSAVFQLGPPPKGESEEQFRKDQIQGKTSHASLSLWWMYLKESKLPSITSRKDPRPWLAKNLRITEENGRRLRFTFQAGTREEQVIILNALLRACLYWHETTIKSTEEIIRMLENQILDLQERSKTNTKEAASYQEDIHELHTKQIPACRAAIARCKQFAVIKWAK